MRKTPLSLCLSVVLVLGCEHASAPTNPLTPGPGARENAAACNVPPEPNRKQSYLSFWKPPYGFAAATPWLNVLHDTRQAGSSTVEIDYIRLLARINGVVDTVAANEYENGGKFGGQLCLRSPWYGGPCENMPGTISNGVLVIQPSSRSDRVWHPYLESWPDPRANISQADSAWIEVRFRITGPALVQAGLDYWKYVGYGSNRLEEAGATDWSCSQGTWEILKLGRGTEVVGAIHLYTTPAGAQPRVGSPITASYTVTNFDDELVGLAEIGIEVRRFSGGTGYCDPADPNGTLVSAFGWDVNVDLAPGASLHRNPSWTPTQPGNYCLTMVERRKNVSTYQKTYYRHSYRALTVF